MITSRLRIGLLAVAILLAGCAAVPSDSSSENSSSSASMDSMEHSSLVSSDAKIMEHSDAPSSVSTVSSAQTASRVIRVIAENWSFAPSTITVKRGEAVTLEIVGVSGRHGFSVPDLGINQAVNPGETVSIDLPTDTAGQYSFRCSIPCGSGHREMVGTIIIE